MKINEYIGKTLNVKVDRPVGSKHPVYDYVYLVNYGYIPQTTSEDGEEIDAYVLGVDKPLKSFKGKVIAFIERENDNDSKLIVTPTDVNYSDEEIMSFVEFQEKYFKSKIIRK